MFGIGELDSVGSFDLEGLRDLAVKAAGVDVSFGSDGELMAAALVLEEVRSLVDAAEAHVLARLDAEAVCDRECGHRTGTWLGHEAAVSKAGARARVRTARRAVGWFATFDAAVTAGEAGWGHMEVLVSVANVRNRDALADAQAELVDLAGRFSFEHWAALVRRLAAEFDLDGGYDPNEDLHANRLRLSANGDMTIEMSGRLVGSARVTVEQTLGSIADELFARFSQDHGVDASIEIPTRATLLALAIEEACRRCNSVELGSRQQPRTEAVMVIEQDTDTDTGSGAVLRSPDGTRLPHSAAALLDDAFLMPLVVNGEGAPLRYGRSRRFATPKQKLALAVRDGGCVFPGCDTAPGHCDAHHEPDFDPSGSTDTHTMMLLCRHHHRITHRPG